MTRKSPVIFSNSVFISRNLGQAPNIQGERRAGSGPHATVMNISYWTFPRKPQSREQRVEWVLTVAL